jgi:hypothetical protein
MIILDANLNRLKSLYSWSYMISSVRGKSVRTGYTFMAKWYRYGPTTVTAMSTYLLHPHLGPPTVSV